MITAGIVVLLSLRWSLLLGTFCLLTLCTGIAVAIGREHPAYQTSWLTLLLLLGPIGWIFYLALGGKKVSSTARRRLAYIQKAHPELFKADGNALSQLEVTHPLLIPQARYITNLSGFPPFEGTTVEYCPLGETQFSWMLKELPKAKRFILLEYFILQEGKMWNTLLDILREKATHGIEILLLYDDLGCLSTLPSHYYKKMESYGFRCSVFNPLRPGLSASLNYRDHRKICVIDGEVGFCGGINLADEYINAYPKHGHWKDTALLLRGEGVAALTRIFLQNWAMSAGNPNENYYRFLSPPLPQPSSGWVQPYASSPLDCHPLARDVYLQMIGKAGHSLYLTSPYLIFDHQMSDALCTAARSGVIVRMLIPHHPDRWIIHLVTRSCLTVLVDAGVEVYAYSPGFIHAKMLVADGQMAVVGTPNLDYRSFFLHYEVAVALYHTPVVAKIQQDIEEILDSCRPITREELDTQPRWQRLLAAFLRLLAPLM